jgi:hypothetical protein
MDIVSILAMFEISRAVDTAPEEVLVSEEQYTDTTISYGHLSRLISRLITLVFQWAKAVQVFNQAIF